MDDVSWTSRRDRSARRLDTTTRASSPRSRQRAGDVVHLNSWMLSEPVLALAERLLATLPDPLSRAMFLSTGGEGIEAALRMAKLFTGRFEVVSLTRSWHGVTGGASAVTYASSRHGYGPVAPGVFALPAPYAYRCPVPPLRSGL